jgi:hypothetical protein
MLNRLVLGVLGVAVLAATPARTQDPAPNTLTQSESQLGWRLLFDGKSLGGWEARTTSDPEASPDWSVRDGTLLCGGTAPSWIGTVDTFANYVLRLQFRGPALVNSGVFLRSQKEGAPHLTGYELQIWDTQPAGYNTGSLVGIVKAPPATMLPDLWNQYEITADGDHIVVVLNDKTVLDTRDAAHSSGVVGLQCQPEQRIEFRNIKLLPRK